MCLDRPSPELIRRRRLPALPGPEERLHSWQRPLLWTCHIRGHVGQWPPWMLCTCLESACCWYIQLGLSPAVQLPSVRVGHLMVEVTSPALDHWLCAWSVPTDGRRSFPGIHHFTLTSVQIYSSLNLLIMSFSLLKITQRATVCTDMAWQGHTTRAEKGRWSLPTWSQNREPGERGVRMREEERPCLSRRDPECTRPWAARSGPPADGVTSQGPHTGRCSATGQPSGESSVSEAIRHQRNDLYITGINTHERLENHTGCLSPHE